MVERFLIGLTLGDPAGIGPEIILKALEKSPLDNACLPIVIGHAQFLEPLISAYRVNLKVHMIDHLSDVDVSGKVLNVYEPPEIEVGIITPGTVSAEAGNLSFAYLESATELVLSGQLAGIVTAPIHKTAWQKAGVIYPGHTEYLAEKTHTTDYAMCFFSEKLNVMLATIHVPYHAVPDLITPENLLQKILLAETLMKGFGIASPRIAVCGLNPHAGENGLFGDEEQTLIFPALAQAIKMGVNVTGPLSGDTVFHHAYTGNYDMVIAMTHDQGLGPLKLVAFDSAVNVTAGLPFVRTSPDHGTAFEIAGKWRANEGSMKAAIKLAQYFIKRKYL